MPDLPPDRIKAQVEGLRRNLLDLTLRNRMLNYKPSRRLSIEITNEESAQLLKLLVTDEKALSFTGIPEAKKIKQGNFLELDHEDPYALSEFRQAAEAEIDTFLDITGQPTPRADTKCNIAEPDSLLQQKLRVMEREAHLANDELGINTLFLTLGTLNWGESGQPLCKAPLLFIPVKLQRLPSGAMRLRHDGNDTGGNLPLQAKLQEFNLWLPEYNDDQPAAQYFSDIESLIAARSDWAISRNEIFLSFFNYEKYSMYIDLGGENWPDGEKPWKNPDIVAMLGEGYSSPESLIGDETHIDEFRPVQSTREVFDADSSQALAMIRAATGLSIVIEGPPGTGKSQTITNIISEAVGAGKTVLFVSAKRAALEVVKRNLTRAELAPMCLDLHDKLSNRREFYEEIKRTVNKGVSAKSEEHKVIRLTELRDQLNVLAESVNAEVEPFGTTPFAAMTRLAQLPFEEPEDRDARIDFSLLRDKNSIEIEQSLGLVHGIERHLTTMGIPSEHPFWSCEIDYLDPASRLDLEEDLRTAIQTLTRCEDAISKAAESLRIEPPSNFNQVRVLHQCLNQALSAPEHQGISITRQDWEQNRFRIQDAIQTLKAIRSLRQKRSAQVTPQIWTASLNHVIQAFDAHAGQWFNFVFGDFKNANRELSSLLSPTGPTSPLERKELVQDVLLVQQAEAKIKDHAEFGTKLYGVQWQGLDSDPELLGDLTKWVFQLLEKISTGELPAEFLMLFSGTYSDDNLKVATLAAESAAQDAQNTYLKVANLLQYAGAGIADDSLPLIRKRLERWRDNLSRLSSYVAFSELRKKLLGLRLTPLAIVADNWKLAPQRLGQVLLRSYYSGVIREAMQSRPALKRFDRPSHESAIEEFRALDDFKLIYNRFLVRSAHQQRLPGFGPATAGNLKTLMLQCQLQRKHRPIRWIMGEAGEAIQRIKPVFMMSPLSVAVHLPPELPKFDLVIFDEASQIKPEDALSAIARAKQCVVVGDTRQMPPTNFFANLSGQDDEFLDDSSDSGSAETKKLESILSLMSAVTGGKVRRPDLRWHYRSIHPSLIQPSNEMFYDGRLVVFPSPGSHFDGKQTGVVFHHLPEAVYESGQTRRVNKVEANAVANRALALIQESPEESVLIAAMNKPQADLIYEEIVRLEAQNPAQFQKYRELHPHEPLDVKNLENVQGDERDVVLLSITYGRDAEGTLRQQFGPLLLDGGERRLNVLITRARNRCEVFSSLIADDIRADSGRAGVLALKSFLRFAERGDLGSTSTIPNPETSPFIEEVAQALSEAGYESKPGIGSEGFRIDLAVIDPEDPESFLLGIECDGPTYEAARSARDRDKLRERVLRKRGWKLHRIWSHDWWQDREAEKIRLFAALEVTDERLEPALPEPEIELIEHEQPASKPPQTRPYVQAPVRAIDSFGRILDEYAIEVVKSEGPIVENLLRIRLKAAVGLTRESPSAKKQLDSVIQRCTAQVLGLSDALAASVEQTLVPRNWSERPAPERKIDFVPDVEISAALRAVISTAYGIHADAATKASFALLGFSRTSESAVARGLKLVEANIESGRLSRNSEGELFIAPIATK